MVIICFTPVFNTEMFTLINANLFFKFFMTLWTFFRDRPITNKRATAIRTVSYTHLDVYKRQPGIPCLARKQHHEMDAESQ